MDVHLKWDIFRSCRVFEGFADGAKVDVYAHSFSTPFLGWLKRKYSLKDMDWNKFRNMFDSDEEALKKLLILYKEYADNL